MRLNRRKLDKRSIEHHYDLSNEFYQQFLDPWMVYTCGYYRSDDVSLEQAQQDKLDLVCRKLQLQPGEHLLDMGCGWGSLTIWAAKHYGAQVTGVTLSREQASYAQRWIEREGLTGLCRVEHLDYRDVAGPQSFDKIAAVGLLEHIGAANYPAYFREIHELLKPDGILLNHSITRATDWRWTPQWAFLTEHVFPNGELRHLSYVTERMEEQTLEILDVESLRNHYARTCAHWAERLQRNRKRAIALVGDKKYRTWLLYLVSSSISFTDNAINLYQVVAGRRDASTKAHRARREEIYATPARSRAQARG